MYLVVVGTHSLAVFQIDQVLSVYQYGVHSMHYNKDNIAQYTYRYKIPKFSFLVIQFDYQ